MHPLSSTPRVRITAGFSTPGGYQCEAEPTWLEQPPPATMLQSTQLLPLPMGSSAPALRRISRDACVLMLLLHQSPVQTDASDSFLCPEQLELRRLLASTLHPRFLHCAARLRLLCRADPSFIVLRYTDAVPDEQKKDFVDNTILAQPKHEKIMQTLPPSDETDVSGKYNSVPQTCCQGSRPTRSSFFCGDCARSSFSAVTVRRPWRPRLLGYRHLFECKLSSDETDQLLSGGR